MYNILYARTKTVRGVHDLTAVLMDTSDGSVSQQVAAATGEAGSPPYRVSIAASVTDLAGNDIRDVLDECADAPLDFRTLGRIDGVLYSIDPLRHQARLTGRAVMQLLASLVAAGRDPARMPIVVVTCRADLPVAQRLAPWDLDRLFDWPSRTYCDVEATNKGAVAGAVVKLLQMIRTASTSRTALPKAAPWTEELYSTSDVEYDWSDAPPSRDRLAQAWRSCRSPRIAELVEAVSYANRSLRPKSIDHAWWVSTCRRRDPRDLPALLDTLLFWENAEAPPNSTARWEHGTPLREHEKQVLERLEGLCWWEDDPRVTGRAGSYLRDMTRYRRIAVSSALCRLLTRHGDPRALAVAIQAEREAMEIRPPLHQRPRLLLWDALAIANALSFRHGQALPGNLVVPPQHQDAWNDLCEQIRRPLPRAEDMEAIAASPHDDELRRELAIRMQERGDPRGEFILLQLRKASGDRLSPEEHEREQALKRTYAWDWLGGIADVVDVENCVFEKGYPVKVTVWTPNTRAIADAIGRPEWGTVRELRWGGDPCWEEDEADPALVNHPVMRSLQVVTTKMPEDPEELAALRRVAWGR